MRRDLTTAAIAVVVLTLALGLAYPLVVTGVSQLLFPGKADGSKIERAGKTVGSRLIGQEFKPRERWFQSRPSPTGYDASATAFNNLGPNNKELSGAIRENAETYVALERPYHPGLRVRDVPADAVTTTASSVDPHISGRNARIQARRVARVRRIPLRRVLELVDEHTDGRGLGVFGEPGVNVLELNLAVEEAARG